MHLEGRDDPSGPSERVEPSLSLAWTREGMDTRSGMSGVLSGVTARPGFQRFTLGGVTEARNGAQIDAAAAVVFGAHGRAFVAYDGVFTETRAEHGFQAGVKIVW